MFCPWGESAAAARLPVRTLMHTVGVARPAHYRLRPLAQAAPTERCNGVHLTHLGKAWLPCSNTAFCRFRQRWLRGMVWRRSSRERDANKKNGE